MTNSDNPGRQALARMRDEHLEQIRRTGTTEGINIKGFPTVLLTYRGAVTGKSRKTPVMRVEHEGRYAVVASKGGEPTNPLWYASVVAEPLVELQDGTVIREYQAREVFGDEKAEWWGRAEDAYPDYAAYQRRTDRQIPFASKAGAPTNPDWYHNVKAHPDIDVEFGTESFAAHVRELPTDEAAKKLASQAALMPQFGEYVASAAPRQIPAFVIERR